MRTDPAGRDGQLRDLLNLMERHRAIYDIFEGTEQIQQLVIARAISGLRIE
jgi:alkylation response protein AidB-like acyl-CoA dehydrogenase